MPQIFIPTPTLPEKESEETELVFVDIFFEEGCIPKYVLVASAPFGA